MKNFAKICVTVLVFIALRTSSTAQSTLIDSIVRGNKIRFDVEGGMYYYDFVSNNVVLLPGIESQRRLNQRVVNNNINQSLSGLWGLGQVNHQNLLTDNPLIHGAGYVTLHFYDAVSKNFDILGSVDGELRGTSYGVYNTANTIVYPQFRFRYHDTFIVFKRKLITIVSVGNYNNIRTDEGLTYYNIDAQALYLQFSYAGFTYEHMHIADLVKVSVSILMMALHIHCITQPQKAKGGEIWKMGIGYDINDQVYGPVFEYKRNFCNVFAALVPDSTSRVYAQLSTIQGSEMDVTNNYAWLFGVKKEKSWKNMTLSGHAEIRYYGNDFKKNFWNQNVYYRSLNPGQYGGDYGNSIGPNLYPLRNYERPFSQFAVFTDQQLNPFDVAGATLYLNADYRIYKQIYFEVNLDINYMTWFLPATGLLDIPNSASFTYPFYKTGIFYRLAKNTKIFAGFTNKGMDLDNTYQTFYLMKSPYYYFEVSRTVQGFLER